MKETILKEKVSNRDSKGRLKKGSVINPGGNNGFTAAKQLIDALKRQGKKRDENFWDMAASRAYTNDQVLIAILKKFIPDRQTLEHDLSDKLLDKFKDLNNADLEQRAQELALGIVGTQRRN